MSGIGVNAKKIRNLFPDESLDDSILDLVVTGVVSDSRKVRPQKLFLGLSSPNYRSDYFINEAIESGASVIAIDSGDNCIPPTWIRPASIDGAIDENTPAIPLIYISHLREKVSAIAGHFYNNPSRDMYLVGVTGTNGKSSCVALMSELWALLGDQSAIIGTLGYGAADSLTETGMTTPDPIECQRILAQFNDDKISHVSMEVSSHGIDQHRVSALNFSVTVLTNITRDHLDYHDTFEKYSQVKASFLEAGSHDYSVINIDDICCQKIVGLIENTKKVITYSIPNREATVHVTECTYTAYGITARVATPWGTGVIRSRLIGEFNLSNLLAVISVVCLSGKPLQKVLRELTKISAIPGRMQNVIIDSTRGADINVYVDFAHTPDALEKVISALRQYASGELWVVFGCGGDRDVGKRDPMGRIVSMLADQAIITSDNPRGENPLDISKEIEKGMQFGAQYKTIIDRKEAIEYAIALASPGDSILIAGKGHESYQEVHGIKAAFDDYSIAKSCLESRAKRQFEASNNVEGLG